jgi:hypothetical protein
MSSRLAPLGKSLPFAFGLYEFDVRAKPDPDVIGQCVYNNLVTKAQSLEGQMTNNVLKYLVTKAR